MRTKILFCIILIFAAFLRFYQLGSNPPSLTWDEVAWGYNGYSLGIDAKDEFGRFLPHDYLESYGDFKPPLYAYLTVLPVKIFGLTEFATRFSSALFGVLTVLMTYFLVRKIFETSKKRDWLGFMAMLVMAISPWHIMLSRGAFEANVAQFLIITGVYLFTRSIKGSVWNLVLSAIFFVLSMYTFNTSRIVSPLLVISMTIGFYKELWNRRRIVIVAGIIGFLFLLPTLPFLFSPQANLRFREVNIFSDISVIENSNQEIVNDNNSILGKVLHNRRLEYSVLYMQHYLDNFNPQFLFISGDGNPRFSTQEVGELFLVDLPFLIIGALFLFRNRKGYWWIIPLWLILGIIPAATARETPHALRIETTIPTMQILIAIGVVETFWWLRQSRPPIFKGFIALFTFLLVFNFLYFYHGYFAHYPRIYSSEWQYGYKAAVTYVSSVKNSYDQIQITEELGRPYIYYLFYTKTLPQDFRASAKIERDAFGFVKVRSFDKYYFANTFNNVDIDHKKILYIVTPGSVPEGAKIQKTFLLLNGKSSMVAYTL